MTETAPQARAMRTMFEVDRTVEEEVLWNWPPPLVRSVVVFFVVVVVVRDVVKNSAVVSS